WHVTRVIGYVPGADLVGQLWADRLEPLRGLGSRRKLGAVDEQLVLEAQDVRVQLRVVARARAAQPQRGGRLVERAVGLGARVGLGDSAPIPQSRRAVVALARVDLDHALDPTLGPGRATRVG